MQEAESKVLDWGFWIERLAPGQRHEPRRLINLIMGADVYKRNGMVKQLKDNS